MIQSFSFSTFSRAQERKVGPGGFLDSTRFSYTFALKKEKEKSQASKPGRPRAQTPDNVVLLTARIQKDEKDYEKRIKVIEVNTSHVFFTDYNKIYAF